MPRKAFLADVASASNMHIPHIVDVKRGEDDGDVEFVYVPVSGEPIIIALIAMGEFPLSEQL
jgi:ubiquitin-conjugating enzyme E2 Q